MRYTVLISALLLVWTAGCGKKTTSRPRPGPAPAPPAPPGPQAGPAKALGAVKSVRFDGGYGHLRNMDFTLNGEVHWSGQEPARKSVSVHHVKLSDDELAWMLDRLRSVRVDELASTYRGCREGYILVFECENGTRKITMDHRGTDSRPEALRSLLEGLWATRSMPSAGRAEQEGDPAGGALEGSFAVLKAWSRTGGKDGRPAVLVFKDEDAYLRRFDRSHPEGDYAPHPRADKVGFTDKQVVAILWGAKPSTAFGMSLLSVSGDRHGVVIRVKTHVADMGGAMVTHPGIALAIPRCAKVQVVVSGDRTGSGAWWGDFASTEEEGLQVIVKRR